MNSSSDIEEFLDGPLVTWLRSCLDDPGKLNDYDDLADGVLIHQVLLLIDPEPVNHGVRPCLGNQALRTRNMEYIVRNIKNLYEDELCQTVVAVPDTYCLGREPQSKQGLQEMHLLLLLLLGCAVQCPNKQNFIERIKTLPIHSQHLLVDCIKQVTESQEIVLTPEGCDSVPNELLLEHIKKLAKQRDQLFQYMSLQADDKKPQVSVASIETQHLAVELADWKAKYRKQRQELEEKTESLVEAREELDMNRNLVSKLKNEMNSLKTAARVGKAYRDEADALREKAECCDKLEAEVNRYKERLTDLEYYRVRVEELRQDNLVLEETREMLEEELARAKQKIEYTARLEEDLLRTRQTINELSLDREANEEKMQELYEENAQLALLSRSALQNNSSSDPDLADELSAADNSLSEQLSSNAQARVLRLELENKRLASTVENFHQASLNQTNDRILQLEKEKKKLSLQVEELDESKQKLMNQVTELENTVKNAQRDTRKMQDVRDSLQTQLQSRVEEVEDLVREKSKLEKKLINLERSMEESKKELDQLQVMAEYKTKSQSLEKEVAKLKLSLESKLVELDKTQNEIEILEKEKCSLTDQVNEANAIITRLSDVEKEMREMVSRSEMERATLAALEKDLVAEKVNSQSLWTTLEKLGLPPESLSDPDLAINKMISNPDVIRAIKERLGGTGHDETLSDGEPTEMSSQNARLQVQISTLQSHVQSLTSQHTALHLANSQLVVEKDDLTKELENVKKDYHQTCVDQLTLQGIHEQLSAQYEALSADKDASKVIIKELKVELKSLKERLDLMTADNQMLQNDREKLKQDLNILINLKTEHSKLKEDFRALFTANEKLKAEYRLAQDEYKSMRSETRQAKAALIQVESELANRTAEFAQSEMHLNKALSQCDMLKEVKANLEEDRRSLMEHVTLLLGQYHELLTHSLEDKEQYHLEEKLYADKLNNLSRQKEKLEEKIMEHYRKMESTHSKKRGFGVSLVRKMRKAGSDLINKGRKSWHEEASRSRGTDSDTSLEEVRTKQEGLGLGLPGSRRTLYMSGDEANPNTNNENDDTKSTSLGEPPCTSTPQHNAGNNVVVYNRVTTVIGGNDTNESRGRASPSDSPNQRLRNPSQQPPPQLKDKNDMWYEYGCV